MKKILLSIISPLLLATLFLQPSIAAIPPVTISSDQIIDDLVINYDLIIEEGVTVTVKGTLSINGYVRNPDCDMCPGPLAGSLENYGTLNNEGSIMIFSDASFVNYGVVNNLGTIDVACTGVFSNIGELLGTEIRRCDKSSIKEDSTELELEENTNKQVFYFLDFVFVAIISLIIIIVVIIIKRRIGFDMKKFKD